MFLTRMELDSAKRKTVMAQSSPRLLHGAIEGAFDGPGRRLWRIDRLGDKTYLLLLSETEPNLCDAVTQFGTENGYETRDYQPFLNAIQNGDCFRFRLRTTPVIAKSKGPGERGVVLAHVTVAQQEQWLYNRAEKYGFSLRPEAFSVVASEWVTFRKHNEDGKQVSFHAVTFEGELQVNDLNLFLQTLQNGIGREKAYGCGLLTLMRVQK